MSDRRREIVDLVEKAATECARYDHDENGHTAAVVHIKYFCEHYHAEMVILNGDDNA